MANTEGGWIDLDRSVMNRRSEGRRVFRHVDPDTRSRLWPPPSRLPEGSREDVRFLCGNTWRAIDRRHNPLKNKGIANMQYCRSLLSHGRDRWFNPSIATISRSATDTLPRRQVQIT
jgi:hypothetical protein